MTDLQYSQGYFAKDKKRDKVHDKSCCYSLLKYRGVKKYKYMCREFWCIILKVCRAGGWSGCVNLCKWIKCVNGIFLYLSSRKKECFIVKKKRKKKINQQIGFITKEEVRLKNAFYLQHSLYLKSEESTCLRCFPWSIHCIPVPVQVSPRWADCGISCKSRGMYRKKERKTLDVFAADDGAAQHQHHQQQQAALNRKRLPKNVSGS